MQETTYYVILFHRDGGDLIGAAPMMAESEIAAVGEAQRLAQEVAGAIVIGRFADSGRFEIIFRTGDLPDTLPDFAAIWPPIRRAQKYPRRGSAFIGRS